ncbi:MAG: class III extradiol dioxygenase subunit B-like domain-containing protein [bacterium]
MITGAAILPHSPLLIESIGKEQTALLAKSLASIEALAQIIKTQNPDTLLIISQHGTAYADAFSINLNEPYRANLEEFGDFGTTFSFTPDPQTTYRIARYNRSSGTPVNLDTDSNLSYGFGIPAHLLQREGLNFNLIPLAPSAQPPKTLFEFGQGLREILEESSKRFFIIAAGDLSHKLDADSPGGFSESGAEFDETIQVALAEKNSVKILQLDPKTVEAAAECLHSPLLILLGVLDKTAYTPQMLSYEAPFGVGYLVANFSLN